MLAAVGFTALHLALAFIAPAPRTDAFEGVTAIRRRYYRTAASLMPTLIRIIGFAVMPASRFMAFLGPDFAGWDMALLVSILWACLYGSARCDHHLWLRYLDQTRHLDRHG